jgi:hypothetical protein
VLAAAEIHGLAFVGGVFDRIELGTLVAAIAKRLRFAPAARTPPVILALSTLTAKGDFAAISGLDIAVLPILLAKYAL